MSESDGYFTPPVSTSSSVDAMCGYYVETYFINTSSGTAYIIERSGVITEVPPNTRVTDNTYPRGCLIIQQMFRGKRQSIESWIGQYYSASPNFQTDALAARAAAINAVPNSGRYDLTSKTICYKVDLGGAVNNKFSKYVHDFDVVVIAGGNLDFALQHNHPASIAGEVVRSVNTPSMESSLYLKVMNVDNNSIKRDLWTIVNGVVCHVPAIEDSELRNGIYVFYPDKNTTKFQANGFRDMKKANEQSEITGLRFFDSESRARLQLLEDNEASNMLRYQEAMAKQKEAQAKSQAAENNLLKARQETTTIAQKAIEEARKHERTIQELEHECIKLQHEVVARDSESRRKNISDTIKYVPTFIAALTALYAVFSKKSS